MIKPRTFPLFHKKNKSEGADHSKGGALRRVAIVGGVRTPFCRSGTLYNDLSNLDLLTTALNGLVNQFNLKNTLIDEVVAGAVIHHAKDFNLTREALLQTKLDPHTPGITIQQACGTSLQAALMSAAKIATGEIECAIAGGTDTTSDAPIVFKRRFAQRLMALGKAKAFGAKASVFKGFSPSEMAPVPPSVAEPITGLSMGQHCELMAKTWHIPRKEQDALAYESHMQAAKAYQEGFHDDLLVSCAGVWQDNILRFDTTLEKLAQLKPSFDKKSGKGTLTAGNSSALTDGAAVVLLASQAWAHERGLPILGYLTMGQTSANNFPAGDGLLMAPTIAVSKLLARAGLSLQEFDFYEIHEAFGAQVLCTLKAWEDADYCQNILGRSQAMGAIDRTKLNRKGSSLAYGHPFAATGARILGTSVKQLQEDNISRGLISICTAGGMGVAAIVESA